MLMSEMLAKLEAENERLRERGDGFAHQRDGWMAAAKGYQAESEHLREVLRRIATDPLCKANAPSIAAEAEAALALRTTGEKTVTGSTESNRKDQKMDGRINGSVYEVEGGGWEAVLWLEIQGVQEGSEVYGNGREAREAVTSAAAGLDYELLLGKEK